MVVTPPVVGGLGVSVTLFVLFIVDGTGAVSGSGTDADGMGIATSCVLVVIGGTSTGSVGGIAGI